MRVFIIVLVLIFSLQSFSKADDISDFEIEGMSVGDSLLDYYSKDEINKFWKINYPSSDDYLGYEISKFLSKIKFAKYDSITLHYKVNDKKMKIVAISGIKLYPDNLQTCLNERDKISKEIKNILSNPVEDQYTGNYGDDNDSKSYSIIYEIDKGSIKLWCTDWDEKTEKENNWEDDLNVGVSTKEFLFWLDNIAYK